MPGARNHPMLENRNINKILFRAAAQPTARDGAAKELGHRGADVDFNRLVVAGEGIGEVGEVLAEVADRLAPDLERQDSLGLVTVRLLCQGSEDRGLLDGGAHGEGVVHAGIEDDIVNEDGSDLLIA